ncbi:MAG: ATP-binding cassette domain-containing protein [Chloroflexi bacterium]|nr:ATP-binding cassette domain-containing protein [Chloroflexota bacterium]
MRKSVEYQEPEPYVLCQDLFKIYKIADLEVVALRGLDLKVETGEIMGIVGASGSGKSTLLNILAGYDSPSAGNVTVGGRDLLNMTLREVMEYRRHEVGFIWQQTSRNLLPFLSALENVELPMMVTGLPTKERHGRALEILELVEMGHRIRHTPDKLSGGEQQRVAIAVALANRPPLLLADEPTGELDDYTAGQVLDLLGNVNREFGTTVIIVTHDPSVVRKVSRVVAIRDGKTSVELRRRVSFKPTESERQEEEVMEELILVDGSGRVQIPKEFLDSLKIRERARMSMEDGKIALRPEEERP